MDQETHVADSAEDWALIGLVEPLEPLLRPEEIAAHLGCSRWLVMERARSGDWPSRRIGRLTRFTREDAATIVALCESARAERKAAREATR